MNSTRMVGYIIFKVQIADFKNKLAKNETLNSLNVIRHCNVTATILFLLYFTPFPLWQKKKVIAF